MAAPSRTITLTVPLFSSDYARDNREIAEWNRRARLGFSALSNELSLLTARATASESGTVKTNQTVSDPVVYLKATVDALLAALQGQIDALSSDVQYVHVQLAPANPWLILHGRTVRPGGIRIMTTPDYREIINVPTDDSVDGRTTVTFGYNVAGIAICVFS